MPAGGKCGADDECKSAADMFRTASERERESRASLFISR
jgi:hypothetical protein